MKCHIIEDVVDSMKSRKQFQLVISECKNDNKMNHSDSESGGCMSGKGVISAGMDYRENLCIGFGKSSPNLQGPTLALHQVVYKLTVITFALCSILQWLCLNSSSYLI